MADKFLIVKLDQYAGNVDEIVCVALTGWGAERYGDEQAQKVFDAKVRPLLEDPSGDLPDMPVGFMEFSTDHGSMPYTLDSSSTNNLRLGIDDYTTDEMLQEMLDIWDKAYGDGEGNLTITVDDIHEETATVKVLGFDLVTTSESRTVIR